MGARLLHLPADRAARMVIDRFLDEARVAIRRLSDVTDQEALHDFRVALRRLRSTERAYREFLEETLNKKLRKRVKAVASLTGPARDAEVQLAWLERQRELIKSHERPGFQWLYRRLRQRVDDEYGLVRARVTKEFAVLDERLRARLQLSYANVDETFAEAAMRRILEAAEALADHLSKVHGESDEDEVHQARIAGKRLRYLLEPLREELPNGRALIKELKQLQDLLGEIHDTQVLSIELSHAAQEAGAQRFRQLIELSIKCAAGDPELEAARRRDERAGLMTLAREVHERRQDLFSQLLAKLQGGDVETLLSHLRTTAVGLQALELQDEVDISDAG